MASSIFHSISLCYQRLILILFELSNKQSFEEGAPGIVIVEFSKLITYYAILNFTILLGFLLFVTLNYSSTC